MDDVNFPEEVEVDEDEVEVFNDSDGTDRREFWTDGEWVRIGRNVADSKGDGGRFIEVKVEELGDFYNTLRAQSGVAKHTLTDSRGSDEKYITDAGYSLEVYSKRRHILYYNDHEYGIFRTAMRKANEMRQTFDYEELVESFADSLVQSYWEVRSVSESGHVEVYAPSNNVSFSFIEDLEESEYVKTRPREPPANVFADEDGMKYQFRVDVESLPGAPDEE